MFTLTCPINYSYLSLKVVIENKEAVGVEFDYEGQTYVVKARKEVIVSAGSINTPQILMLSGIGPRKELERHRVSTCRHDGCHY